MKDFIDFVKDQTTHTPMYLAEDTWGPLPMRGVDYPDYQYLSQDQLYQSYTNSSMHPTPIEKTLDVWLYRIKHWGEPQYEHKDPGGKRRKINETEFLNIYGDQANIRALGMWRIEHLDYAKLTFYREAYGPGGKKGREELVVRIKLNKAFKSATSWWRVLNPFVK
jgi:hypothetical protein